jgi:competence ComEA-like helix-hairpin-helix protein
MPAQSAPLDLNTAVREELETVDGIGPALADAIVAYRETKGPFTEVDQLDLVPAVEQLPDGERDRLKGRFAVRPRPGAEEVAPGTRLDLNRASAEELRVIRGLGEGRAEEIVRHRSRIDGFSSVDEIDDVPLLKHLTEGERGWIKRHVFVA